MPETALPAPKIKGQIDALRLNIAQVIQGKDAVINHILVCLLAGGHVLIEDLPGLGKTTLAYCLAKSLDCRFSRIQFTSDLLPADVIGVTIYDEKRSEFRFTQGPVFTDILLADEINRTTPKTQSALLEAMDRGKVSIDGNTYELGKPFMVIATQNPVDYEGTFPLPESQMDRFLMRLQMGYPEFEDELKILENDYRHYDTIETGPVLDGATINEIQAIVPQVFIEDSVLRYLLKIVQATRTETEFRAGISTRGTLALKAAAQARALAHGRAFVMPEDVTTMVLPVCTHRLSLRRQTSDTLEERRIVEGVLKKITDALPRPT